MKRITRRFSGEKACAHLYRVTCGMDSMVVGEDEILGQVRTAYLFSSERGRCGYELNAVFQGALACAKKIKTETLLSKTSVSVRPSPVRKFSGLKSSEAERRTVRIRIRGSFRCCSSAAAGRWAEAC